MIKKYFYLLLVAVFVIPKSSFAQYNIPSKESSDKLKSRTLLVEMFDDNSESSNEYNKVIQSSFKDVWTYTPVEFLPTKDFQIKIASGDDKYAVFHPYNAKYTFTTQYEKNNSIMNNPYSWQKSNKEPVISNISWLAGQWNWVYESFGFGISLLSPTAIKSKEQPICLVLFANDIITSSDLLFTTQQLTALVNAGAKNISGLDYYNPMSFT